MTSVEDHVSTYDYVVIGGGTSGSVVARRLAESEKHYNVCLLEAGPSHEDIYSSHMPGGMGAIDRTKLDWNYDMVLQKGCNNRNLITVRGRFLGGTSGMNGTVVVRGAKADYDRIADMGNPGWSWQEMMPYFKASETFHPVDWHQADLSVHGTDGPLHTSPHRLAPISEKTLESFIDYGFQYKPDMFVQGEYEGVGHAIRSVYNGVRSTSADFVHNCKLENLTVKTGVFVDRIIVNNNGKSNAENREYRAVGVEAHDDVNGQPMIIKARKEIILSAGAYNSPMILMHSGIGPKEHLIEMNIDCKIDLPGVGENLIDHPIVFTSYQVSEPNLTLDRLVFHNPETVLAAIKEWNETKTGLMSTVPFGPFALTRIDKTIRDPVWEAEKLKQQCDDPSGQLPTQPHIEFLTTELFSGPPHYAEVNPNNPVNGESVITLITLLCRQLSTGTIRLSSNDPTSKPIIDHAYLTNDLDVAVLAEGCRIGHEVLTKGRATKDIISGPWPKTVSIPTDLDGWKEHVREFTTSCGHPGGTCKMAPNSDPMGVVDHRLRVRNVENLRVADVSIMPILNSGHTQAPAYAIGEKVAHMVLQDELI
ncbi:unnamed protein product [Adineta ricciae]|uniref:Glucose-methanol-choline oxidoreductase N-terminal domain-containing protein n=1 Tax=Adineta ricciae TaxID=249248 RepID=A0A815PU13_ADIRI|nr:unnamed protein product [Adineta ricciae]CAF1454154.1 unnamed protein product [Adineta ricciae]